MELCFFRALTHRYIYDLDDEFQALQLIVLVVFGAMYVCWPTFLKLVLNES